MSDIPFKAQVEGTIVGDLYKRAAKNIFPSQNEDFDKYDEEITSGTMETVAEMATQLGALSAVGQIPTATNIIEKGIEASSQYIFDFQREQHLLPFINAMSIALNFIEMCGKIILEAVYFTFYTSLYAVTDFALSKVDQEWKNRENEPSEAKTWKGKIGRIVTRDFWKDTVGKSAVKWIEGFSGHDKLREEIKEVAERKIKIEEMKQKKAEKLHENRPDEYYASNLRRKEAVKSSSSRAASVA